MTDIDLNALRKVAQEAQAVTSLAFEVGLPDGWDLSGIPSELSQHIAAFDPPTVLALLDRLGAAEAAWDAHDTDCAAVQAKVARVEALLDEFKSRGGLTLLVETGESVAGMLEAALEDRA